MPIPTSVKIGCRILAALSACALFLFLVAANFSAVETRYVCSGDVTNDGIRHPLTLYIKLNKYRWWVHLWSDSYGDLWIEAPSETVEYLNHIRQVGDQLQLFDDNLRGVKDMRGWFSTLSSYLSVKVVGLGFFDGSCKKISDA